ncbi:hypothetical protein THAOC_30841 [Thalassiosira oceanica]|uniref:Uncharacterized protein n=1 Tax=Thalassiosira oceanica TaxID=159749 RepID=K0R9I5_THAOC|nr:hypothetical protein THAOC_30841 [Thalassiosira oceanica]|mmetsp:Transcript_34124/g.76821  ORF Transcript_34124/g.76821 Transcript_34124/m.76821 type:complete len:284 (+) Transcript_34124:180-1031(+)|eukprot:EJK50218.1 hypothetical protein THAOC_30841 [Thalassiosira oceanica]
MVMRRRVSIDVGDVDAIHAAAERPRHVLRDVAIVAAILGAACLLLNRAATATDSSRSSPLVFHDCIPIDVLNITCEGEHHRSFFDIHRESFGDSSEGEQDEDDEDEGEDQPIRREAVAASSPYEEPHKQEEPNRPLKVGDFVELFGVHSTFAIPALVDDVFDGGESFALIYGTNNQRIPKVDKEFVHPYQTYQEGTEANCNIGNMRSIVMTPCKIARSVVKDSSNFVVYEVVYLNEQREMTKIFMPFTRVQRYHFTDCSPQPFISAEERLLSEKRFNIDGRQQ